jgi:uncharacterized protein YecT (DUF1311 family)
MLASMKTVLALVALLCVSGVSLAGQSTDASGQNEAICNKYLQTPLPAEASTVATPKAWPECDSYKHYFGLETKADFAAARACAWSERLATQENKEPRYTVASLFGGSAMLTVLYANGEGVERNIPLALRFACEGELSENGLSDIGKLSWSSASGRKRFKYCDEAFTTFEMNFCAELDSEIAKQKRSDRLSTLSLKWSKEEKESFNSLMQADEVYVDAHGWGETYLGGTIHVLRVSGVEERMRDKFLAAVEAFEAGHLPRGTASDFGKVDAELNLLYREALKAADADKSGDEGAIKSEGIRKAERAWLKYRDAWVAFAKRRYPETDANAWLTLLTTNRSASLRMTLCGIDSDDSSCPRKEAKPDPRAVP